MISCTGDHSMSKVQEWFTLDAHHRGGDFLLWWAVWRRLANSFPTCALFQHFILKVFFFTLSYGCSRFPKQASALCRSLSLQSTAVCFFCFLTIIVFSPFEHLQQDFTYCSGFKEQTFCCLLWNVPNCVQPQPWILTFNSYLNIRKRWIFSL